MLHLRPRRPELIPKLQLHILLQMARDLDMPYVRRMPLGRDIVVLEDTRRVEVVDEFVLWAGREGGVVLVYLVDFGDEGPVFGVCVAGGVEAVPEGLRDRVSSLGSWERGGRVIKHTKMMIWASGQVSWIPSMRLR